MPPPAEGRFDPLGLLAALQRRHVSFIVIGAFARVIQGTDELTRSVDITPWMRPTTLNNLELALADLNAHRTDGKSLTLDTDEPVLELQTDCGQLKIVPRPRRNPRLRRPPPRRHPRAPRERRPPADHIRRRPDPHGRRPRP